MAISNYLEVLLLAQNPEGLPVSKRVVTYLVAFPTKGSEPVLDE